MMKNLMLLLMLFLLTGITITPAFATTYYADAAKADNSGDGLTWATAKKDVQNAIDLAVNGDQVWVKAGIYKPSACTTCNTTDREVSFVMKNGVAIYGGFTGIETMLSERSWVTNVTTLSGDIGTSNDNSDNSYHVIFNNNNGLNSTAVMDGFTVTGGNANTGITPHNEGGGMYNQNASPTITNTTFTGNSAAGGGGGMWNESSTPTITNTTFTGNSATGVGGGGMSNYLFSTPTISNTTFAGNTVGYGGGGMSNLSFSSPAITNTTFTGNSGGTGGGMFNFDSSSPNITNTTFTGNSANFGGGMYNEENSKPIIHNSILWGNGIEIYNLPQSVAIITHSIVQGGYSGMGNLNLDPFYVDAANIAGTDNIYRTADDGLRLKPCSPAINTGDNTGVAATDITGATRIQQTTVDMGAYENAYNLSSSFLSADAECTDGAGITHYYNKVNEALILSIQKNGNNIGNIGDGTFTIASGGAGVSNLGINGTIAPYATTDNWHTMNRYWKVTPTTPPASDVNVRFYYRPEDFNEVQTAAGIAAETDMVMYKINGTGNPDPTTAHAGTPATPATAYNADGYWEYTNGGSASTANWVSGVFNGNKFAEIRNASFSGGGGGACNGINNGALPIELLSFSGKNTGRYNFLEWRTANEINNKGFDVERSTDGLLFEKMGFVSGKGGPGNDYSFQDNIPRAGINYYRLRQIDNDGQFEYSGIIAINDDSGIFAIYPNPGKDVFHFLGKVITDQYIMISNALGQRFQVRLVQNQLDLSRLPSGLYYLNLDGYTFKLVKE